MIFRCTSTKINTNINYQTMDEIIILIGIAEDYHFMGRHSFESIDVIDEGVQYETFHNEHYDEHYRICYEAATNFISKSDVFSELKPEEIIKAFANMKFKDNRILIDSRMGSLYVYAVVTTHRSDHLKLFEELLRINKEMLLALIKAINDKKITYDRSYYFVDENGVLGASSDINDYTMINLYRILLEYNHFSLDNLNLKNILNDLRPPITKRAV